MVEDNFSEKDKKDMLMSAIAGKMEGLTEAQLARIYAMIVGILQST